MSAQKAATKKHTKGKSPAKKPAQAAKPAAKKAAPARAGVGGGKAQAQVQSQDKAKDGRLGRELVGVAIAIVAIALFIAVVAPGEAILSRGISDIVKQAIGVGAYILPFLLLLWAASFFIERGIASSTLRLGAGLSVILFSALAMLALSTPGISLDAAVIFEPANLAAHGGYVGAGVAWALLKLVGSGIALVILIGLVIVGVVIIGFSITGMVQRIRNWVERRMQQRETDRLNRRSLDGAYDQGLYDANGMPLFDVDPEAAMMPATARLSDNLDRTAVLANTQSPAYDPNYGYDLSLYGDGGLIEQEDLGSTRRVIAEQDWQMEAERVGEGYDLEGRPSAYRGGRNSGVHAAASALVATNAKDAKAAKNARDRKTSAEKKAAKAEADAVANNDAALLNFDLPDPQLLKVSRSRAGSKTGESELRRTAAELQTTLEEFGVDATVEGWVAGPTVTLFKLSLGEGVRLNRINALADDIALALAAPAVRIFSPIPGTTLVGIEVPNVNRSFVLLGDVLPDADAGALQLAVGKDVEGASIVGNLEKMPHLLIGGTTGSGKSVAINCMIMSVLMRATPAQVRMILIDPKMVELSLYNDIPHLYVPVVTDAQKAASALAWGVIEMERRLKLFQQVGAKNIAQYNEHIRRQIAEIKKTAEREAKKRAQAEAKAAEKAAEKAASMSVAAELIDAEEVRDSESFGLGGHETDDYETDAYGVAIQRPSEDLTASASNSSTTFAGTVSEELPASASAKLHVSVSAAELPEELPEEIPLVLIVIDELADLMMVAGKEVETSISRLAQLARAAGLHLIIATQRPSTNVITGLIKANIVNRIAFNVASGIDSRVILDSPGAEDLIGNGDLLFSRPEVGKPQRIQGCYVSEPEIEAVVSFLKEQAAPKYREDILSTAVGGMSIMQMAAGDAGDDDPLIWEAAEIVVATQFGSTSTLQRRLKVGYARAGRIMDMLEQKGIVGPPNGSKPREVMIDDVLDLESLKAIEASDAQSDMW